MKGFLFAALLAALTSFVAIPAHADPINFELSLGQQCHRPYVVHDGHCVLPRREGPVVIEGYPPLQAQPYAGALRAGHCEDPHAAFINANVGCVRRVSDPAIMEKYRAKISDVCEHSGDNVVVLPDGGKAHYMCP